MGRNFENIGIPFYVAYIPGRGPGRGCPVSGRPRLRGVGRVRAVYLVRHENRVLGVGFVGGGVRRDEAEHQGGTNRGATRGVGVADHRLRGVSRRQQTMASAILSTAAPKFIPSWMPSPVLPSTPTVQDPVMGWRWYSKSPVCGSQRPRPLPRARKAGEP